MRGRRRGDKRRPLSSRVTYKPYTSGGGGFLSMCSCVVRGENSATRKAMPNKASNPNKTRVQIPAGASPPVTGMTSGVPSTTTTVGGTRVTAGGTAVSWYFTACGAAGDPKALRNNTNSLKHSSDPSLRVSPRNHEAIPRKTEHFLAVFETHAPARSAGVASSGWVSIRNERYSTTNPPRNEEGCF